MAEANKERSKAWDVGKREIFHHLVWKQLLHQGCPGGDECQVPPSFDGGLDEESEPESLSDPEPLTSLSSVCVPSQESVEV